MNESPATASLHSATPKEKTLLAFLIWRGKISFEKGKGVFLSGSALNESGSVAGLQFRPGKTEKLFSGDLDFRFASADFPPAERGLGNECGRDSVSDFSAASKKTRKLLK